MQREAAPLRDYSQAVQGKEMNILFCEADEERELSTSVVLCRTPAKAINRGGRGKHQARVVHRNEFLNSPVDTWPDLVVFERLLVTPIIEKIKEYKSAGMPTIVRFDDAYHLLPSYISSSVLWRRSIILGEKDGRPVGFKMQQSMLKQFREGLGICDAASTPSRLLCQDYERYAKKMYYIPNFPDLGNPAWTAPKPRTRKRLKSKH